MLQRIKIIKKLSLFLAATLLGTGISFSQNISPISPWVYGTGGNITTTLPTSGVKIPSLATGGNPCLKIDSNGNLFTATCSSASGTVTGFSFTNGNGFTGTVTNPSTTPALSLSLQNASGSQSGQLSSTDWNTFNGKQSALGFTPVPDSRTLTINGTAYDLTANRSWTISAGTGNVVGPASATDTAVAKFDGTTGKLIKNSGVTIDDTNNVAGVVNESITGFLNSTGISTPSLPTVGDYRLFGQTTQGFTRPAILGGTTTPITVTRDLTAVVRNTTGATLTKGTVVYVSGSTGSVPLVSKALANASSTIGTIGVIFEDIANNSYGIALTRGAIVTDTSAFSTGDEVYVSASVAGTLTNVAPAHPNFQRKVGVVLNSGVGNGVLAIDIGSTAGNDFGTAQNIFAIGSNTAGTKTIQFKNGSTGSLSWTPTAARTLTLPDATDTLIGKDTTDTLTNKTLTSPTFTGTPLAPTAAAGDSTTQIATTEFVQSAVRSVPSKEASQYATTTALPSVTYNNGSSGVGATLTAVAVGAISIDGSSPTVGQRILVKNQASTFQNGIYTVTATGSGVAVFVLTRALDFNQSQDVKTGAATYVVGGSTLGATTWDVNSADSPVMGTDAITFIQSAGPGSLIAGNGISISGNTVAINTGVTADLSSSQSFTNKNLTSGNTFPTFNQDTTGKSAKTDALNSATTTVNVSSATAPTAGQVLTATSGTTATWQTPSGGSTTPALISTWEFPTSTDRTIRETGGSGAAITGNSGGGSITTSGSGNSYARLRLQYIGDVDNFETGSPQFSTQISTTTRGTDFDSFFGLGLTTISGTGHIYTSKHIGFKIIRTASGTINLYATQADGTTENSTLLTTIATGSRTIIDLLLKVNGTSSVDYYYRLNGGTMSSATNLTSNMPTGLPSMMTASLTDTNVASTTSFTIGSFSYSR